MKIIPVLLFTCSSILAVIDAGAGQPGSVHVRYHCESEMLVKVIYAQAADNLAFADIQFNKKSYRLKQIRAASGARYSADGVVWWSKGDQSLLRLDEHALHTSCLRVAL